MDDRTRARVRSLQARIDAALRESPDETARSTFSSYLPGASTDVQSRLWTTPATGGIEDLEEILDRFEHLAGSEDSARLRHALSVVLTHHPSVDALGLRLPSLEERSPSKIWPSRREP